MSAFATKRLAYRNGNTDVCLGVECAYMPDLMKRSKRAAPTQDREPRLRGERIRIARRIRLAVVVAMIVLASSGLIALHYAVRLSA